jgi:hypothetical protein
MVGSGSYPGAGWEQLEKALQSTPTWKDLVKSMGVSYNIKKTEEVTPCNLPP